MEGTSISAPGPCRDWCHGGVKRSDQVATTFLAAETMSQEPRPSCLGQPGSNVQNTTEMGMQRQGCTLEGSPKQDHRQGKVEQARPRGLSGQSPQSLQML